VQPVDQPAIGRAPEKPKNHDFRFTRSIAAEEPRTCFSQPRGLGIHGLRCKQIL
jgi:hypothetical protein